MDVRGRGIRDAGLRIARRMAMLLAAVVGTIAAMTLLLWGCATAVERSWNPPERRDAEVRCPHAQNAEVRIGGWGEPDWCVRIDAQGNEYGEWLLAGPYD